MRLPPLLTIFIVGLTMGCGEPTEERCAPATSPAPAPMRRLTRAEYDTTVYQLLGTLIRPARLLAPDEEALGFDNQAAAQSVSPLLAEQYLTAAETLAAEQAPRLAQTLTGCVAGATSTDCSAAARRWISELGARAFRRPLTEAEADRYLLLFQDGAALSEPPDDPAAGVELVIVALLQSPHFLYRLEFGEVGPDGNRRPTAHELATRLSYLVWGGMPDLALTEAATAGTLHDPEELTWQARRMLEAPLARGAVLRFFEQWLRLDEVESVTASQGKDEERFPDYHDGVLTKLRGETEAFLETAIFEEQAGLDELFTASWTMLDAELVDWYDLTGPGLPTGSAFERVELDPTRHAGLLTHSGLLALYAKPDRSSPVHRGKWVRESLLCQIPPPPPDVVPEPPEVDETQTTRERFAQHEADPACSGCHKLLDPIGLGFEHFDATGRYRETEDGLPIDATGEVLNGGDATGAFDGAVQLAHQLAASDQVQRCFTTQWYRYALGRTETEADQCALDQVHNDLVAADLDLGALIVALATAPTFRAAPHGDQP
jgi:hypothetical protein